MKIKIFIFPTFLLSLITQFFIPSKVKAINSEIQVDLFQITSDGSQQSTPLIYEDLVAYTNFGGSHGIDIWGYNLSTNENFPIIEKEGTQFLTGLHKDLVIYENTEPGDLTTDLRAYDIHSNEDILIAGGEGSQTSGVTNGKEVLYIEGGACGRLYAYNLRRGKRSLIVGSTCHPIRIWRNIVVFPEAHPDGTNIKGYNLATKQIFDIATDSAFQEVPNIYGNKVVWLHRLSGALGDYNSIVYKSLSTGKVKTVYESLTSTLNWPAVSNHYVVWSESTAQHVGGVKGYNLRTGEIFEIQEQGSHQNSHTMQSIWKNITVWQAWRTGNGDLYGAELSNQHYH